MVNQETYKVVISAYQVEWVEQAKSREERGLPIDDGTLAMLGTIFLEGIEL